MSAQKSNFKHTIMILAGEPSGDERAAELVKAIANQSNEPIRFIGMAGPRMREAGVETIVDATPMAIIGFVEILKKLPLIFSAFRKLKRALIHENPDRVILVDYPGFNLRFARTAASLGIKSTYYIPPQVWAWHKSRLKVIKKYIDKLIVLFPFEVPFYLKAGIEVSQTAHPLLNITQNVIKVTEKENTIALLPGSRTQEIERLLPTMVDAANRLPYTPFVIASPSLLKNKHCMAILKRNNIPCYTNNKHQRIAKASCAIVASGTASLETALLQTPMVVIYKTHPITFWLAKLLSHVDYCSLPNLVSGKRIVPELLQEKVTAKGICDAIKSKPKTIPTLKTALEGKPLYAIADEILESLQ